MGYLDIASIILIALGFGVLLMAGFKTVQIRTLLKKAGFKLNLSIGLIVALFSAGFVSSLVFVHTYFTRDLMVVFSAFFLAATLFGLNLVSAFCKVIGAVTQQNKKLIISQDKTQEESSRSEEFYRQLLDNSVGVCETDQYGMIWYVNDKYCQFCKMSRDELIGNTHQIIRSGAHTKDYYKQMWDTISAGHVWIGDFKNIAGDGSALWLHTTIVPRLNSKGEPEKYVAIAFEITQLKAAQDKLVVAKEAAEEAIVSKSKFLTNMTHELRSPLNAIYGFARVLINQNYGEVNEKQESYLKDILDSSQHLLSLINDMLDQAKIEAGKMKFVPEIVHLNPIVLSAATVVQEEMKAKNIKYEVQISNAFRIWGNERMIRQIFYNLLSNSVKFTPEGGEVGVEVRRVSDQDIRVKVWDTGIGIAPENADKIFSEFEQLDSGLDREFEGTGLGLSLTRNLVSLHGGKIWFESEGQGKGTAFYFTLPSQETHLGGLASEPVGEVADG